MDAGSGSWTHHCSQHNQHSHTRISGQSRHQSVQQTQDHQQPLRGAAHQQQQAWRALEYAQYWKSKHAHLASIDTVFFAIHLLMSAVHKRVLVTAREQLGFGCAMAIFAGALLMRLFFSNLYNRVRPRLVFVIHMLLTIIRACVVKTMDSKQAVHYRPGMVSEENHTAFVLATTMLAILGGPFRLFEMMGLQQPWRYHALNTVLYLVVHPCFAADGMRLAYSNSMFYTVHAVHDAVSAVFDSLTDAVAGLPAGQQQTCSSCAGVAVYGFMCLLCSVAVPLYTMFVWEQNAMKRWLQTASGALSSDTLAAAQAAQPSSSRSTTDGMDSSATAAGQAAGVLQDSTDVPSVQGQHSASRHSRHTSSSSASSTSSDTSNSAGSSGRRMTRMEAICQRAEAVAEEQLAASAQLPSLLELVTSSNPLVRWCTHLVVLVAMTMACWLVANGFALVLLPRVLNSQQLNRWCPNRPYTPYSIAGEVYQGL